MLDSLPLEEEVAKAGTDVIPNYMAMDIISAADCLGFIINSLHCVRSLLYISQDLIDLYSEIIYTFLLNPILS